MTTLSALDILALTIFGEARGESVEGKLAVANVCRNRLRSNRWGGTYEQVCLARLQFSCWSPLGGQANYARLASLRDQIAGGTMPPDPVLRECYTIAQHLDGFQDNVERATHYYVMASPMPNWARNQAPVCVIGAHAFFAGIK